MFQQITAFIISIILIILTAITGYCAEREQYMGGGNANITDNITNNVADPPEVVGGTREPLTKLQRATTTQYAHLKLPRRKISFDEFCFPRKFQLQKPQQFVAEYVSPATGNMNLLGFHRIGAGKTCAAITAAERWVDRGRPLIVMPASLIPGFRNELRGPCPAASGGHYITPEEAEEMHSLQPHSERYREIIKKSDALIDARYTIMSYNKFATKGHGLDPPILIIDEVHNINNPSGTYYNMFMKFIEKRPRMRLLVLSATPVFDSIDEIVSLMRLLRQDVDASILDNPAALAGRIDGLVSYYEGAPAHTFPKTTLHHEICVMSKFQSHWYTAEVEAEIKRSGEIGLHEIPNNFYSKSRAKSNMVFPHGLSGTDGLPKLTDERIRTSLDIYSCKFARLIRKLNRGELSFIYTNFTSFGGVKSMRRVLKAFGYVEYNKHGAGPKRFAIWTGEQTPREKDAIRNVFNSQGNDNAGLIQIIIGSPAAKEGVSFMRLRQIHVMEPYWNHARMRQIYGRGERMCAHRSLPKHERQLDIYLYVAVTSSSKITKRNFDNYPNVKPQESIDAYILAIADKKQDAIDEILEIIVNTAVDRGLNQG